MRLIDPDNYQLGYDNYVEYPEQQLVFPEFVEWREDQQDVAAVTSLLRRPQQLIFPEIIEWLIKEINNEDKEDLIVTCSRGCGRMRECNPYSCQNDWKPTPSGSNYQ